MSVIKHLKETTTTLFNSSYNWTPKKRTVDILVKTRLHNDALFENVDESQYR